MADDGRDRQLADSRKALQDDVRRTGSAAATGYSLIGAILLLGGLGYAWDRWQGTSPDGVVTGVLAGVVAGLYLVARDMWRR